MYLSPEFALGFFVLFAIYWYFEASVSAQNRLLLLFSWLFYASLDVPLLVYLLLFSASVHLLARRIRHSQGASRRSWLIIGLSCLATFLCSLKYYLPLRDLLAPYLAGSSGWEIKLLSLELLVPIGVSFYTFQAVALLVACYRDDPACRDLTLTETGLYLAFFPTVVAGPICRPEFLLPQLRQPRLFVDPAHGLGLVVRGLFKKLVVAQWLASTWVDPLFASPADFNGLELALGAAAYAVQIYADFSGLTDLVMGLAWLLGFRLADNFNQPYLARSPQEFWRRWHMSLSTWIRDFIYIPLGGSRRGLWQTQFNLLAAMVFSGLWHGAGWNYLVWGVLHGMACVLGNVWPKHLLPPSLMRLPLTFIFVSFAWIFFRAPDIDQALAYLLAMGDWTKPFSYNVLGGLLLLGGFFGVQQLSARFREPLRARLAQLAWPAQLTGLTLITWVCIELGPSGIPAFIYSRY
ncbi:MAG: alginate O-acetylation protein AlgI [Comamonadaceae bacterium]|nr:MAG: alginate O-acetylation protein AlgI [Comamonadaceae bacterium]